MPLTHEPPTLPTGADRPARRRLDTPLPHLELLVSEAGRDMRAKRPHLLTSLFGRTLLTRAINAASLITIDLALLFAAALLALVGKSLMIGEGATWHESAAYAADVLPFAGLVMVLLFAGYGLYAQRAARPGAARIIASLFQVTLLALLIAEIEGRHFSSYYIFYSTLVIASILIVAGRWLYDTIAESIERFAGHSRRAVIVGGGRQIESVARALTSDPHSGTRPVGFIASGPLSADGLRDMGPLANLKSHFHEIDEVIIADPDFPDDDAFELVDRCHRAGVAVRIAPSTMEILAHRAELVPGQSLALLELKPPVFEGFDFVVKRSFDIMASLIGLIVLAPVIAAVATLVKLTSPGPVIYRSTRPGIGGVPFDCLKFRTMRAGADAEQDALETLNQADGALFKISRDPRLTPIGHFLRRHSLDELPQLINVLRGEMSLVGPRPLPMRDYELLEPWHQKRYLVLPGVTGLWQVSGRSSLDCDELVRLDFLYIERWSVFLDIVIVLKTIPAVLLRRGAW